VEVACGNEHTAILFWEQPLIMFGQHEGGIISGAGHPFDSVACGGLHTLGIRNSKVYSWGRGEGGQLGHKPEFLKTKTKKESTDFYLDEPKMININQNIRKAVCGDAHSVLLT
jgi:alpha-tubulin suppressor-like RCC1 family protein